MYLSAIGQIRYQSRVVEACSFKPLLDYGVAGWVAGGTVLVHLATLVCAFAQENEV